MSQCRHGVLKFKTWRHIKCIISAAQTCPPLGTMFKNGAECIIGMLVFQDIAQGHEKQQEKY